MPSRLYQVMFCYLVNGSAKKNTPLNKANTSHMQIVGILVQHCLNSLQVSFCAPIEWLFMSKARGLRHCFVWYYACVRWTYGSVCVNDWNVCITTFTHSNGNYEQRNKNIKHSLDFPLIVPNWYWFFTIVSLFLLLCV